MSGDTDLPRVPTQGRRTLAVEDGPGVVSFLPFETGPAMTPIAPNGGDPAVSYSGRVIAYRDADTGQIAIAPTVSPASVTFVTDSSGTSDNPSLDKRGQTLVFESEGDLTALGSPGVRRVYKLNRKDGALSVVSSGVGTSGNAMVSAKGETIAFESTSDPSTGLDTGVPQIWLVKDGVVALAPITAGAGASTRPNVSDDGRMVVFESTADLANDGADTGTKQIFAYDYVSGAYAQLTNELAGCARPAVAKVSGDWRITFVCDGQAYYHMWEEDARYHVETLGGATQAITPEMGVHFVTLSTTADLLLGGGATPGYQLYMVNLFVRPATPLPGGAVAWF
jgi:hypothetical protein